MKIAVNVVISIQWIVDNVGGVATFNLIAQIIGDVTMLLPLQRPAFLYLMSMFMYLLIKLGAVIALVKVSTTFNFFRAFHELYHTTYNGQNMWTKILSHETIIFGLKMMVKSGLNFFILKSYVPLQSCCCPVQKNLPIMAELAWQVSRYL